MKREGDLAIRDKVNPSTRNWALNRSCFLSLAAFRTLFNPGDIRFPHCVGRMRDGTMLPSVCALTLLDPRGILSPQLVS